MKRSDDGGKTWSERLPVPESWATSQEVPTIHRVVDFQGKKRLILFSGLYPIRMALSEDDGNSWTELQPIGKFGGIVAVASVMKLRTGDRHTGKYAPDGRLFISFRDRTPQSNSPTEGDWVGWIGTYEDIVHGHEGQYRIKLMDNTQDWDCAYPGVEVLPDGTFVTTTYGHWTEGESPYIVSVRFALKEIDQMSSAKIR